MVDKLKKRLERYKKKMKVLEVLYTTGSIPFEVYFEDRFNLDKKVAAIFELKKKNIHNEEFSDAQLDIWLDMIGKVG